MLNYTKIGHQAVFENFNLDFIPPFICDDFWPHSTNRTSLFVFACTKILATA